MAERLKSSNPEAFRNILKRMLEANGRGFWNADPRTLNKIQDMFDEVEDQIEGLL